MLSATHYEAGRRFVLSLDWIGELKNPAIVKADVLAGITVALVPSGLNAE